MTHLFDTSGNKERAVRVWPARGPLRALLCVVFAMLLLGSDQKSLRGQQQAKTKLPRLPSAEKLIENYLKALGGKKRVATIRDASYEWMIQLANQPMGIARTQTKTPASVRTEMKFGNGQLISAANGRSAWTHGLDGKLHTLTDGEAAAAKLQALLDASHILNIKKSNVLARVVSVRESQTNPAYVVEFSLLSGARLRYLFSITTKLPIGIEDDARQTTSRFEDYRTEGNIPEPHRVIINAGGTGELTFVLQRANYNTGIVDSIFDPPRTAEALDVTALLRDVARNQDELEKRFPEYSFLQKETDREITSKGEVKKETVKVFEVFPIANREPIMKLVSENGVALAGERAAKEQKRVEEEFLKAERDKDKNEQREKRRAAQQPKKAARGKAEDDDVEISQFLKVCEFVSPRRERFRERDAIVFDFRVRPGFKSSNRQEDLISKLVGVVWIDPADKQVMRLEARLAEGFKMAGGLLVNLRPGAAFVMEQTRMVEGVWLPRLAQINLSVKVLLFGGGDYNKTIEWSDYKHFAGDVGDYKLDAPRTEAQQDKKP